MGTGLLGCIAFLVASHLYWRDTRSRRTSNDTHDAAWWSSLLNYVGSVFFMASAIGAFTLRTTGDTLNIALVNTGTFLGALCFLVGSYVLLPSSSPTVSS